MPCDGLLELLWSKFSTAVPSDQFLVNINTYGTSSGKGVPGRALAMKDESHKVISLSYLKCAMNRMVPPIAFAYRHSNPVEARCRMRARGRGRARSLPRLRLRCEASRGRAEPRTNRPLRSRLVEVAAQLP